MLVFLFSSQNIFMFSLLLSRSFSVISVSSFPVSTLVLFCPLYFTFPVTNLVYLLCACLFPALLPFNLVPVFPLILPGVSRILFRSICSCPSRTNLDPFLIRFLPRSSFYVPLDFVLWSSLPSFMSSSFWSQYLAQDFSLLILQFFCLGLSYCGRHGRSSAAAFAKSIVARLLRERCFTPKSSKAKD